MSARNRSFSEVPSRRPKKVDSLKRIKNTLKKIYPISRYYKRLNNYKRRIDELSLQLQAETIWRAEINQKDAPAGKKPDLDLYRTFRPVLAECHAALSSPSVPPNERLVRKIIEGYNKLYSEEPELSTWSQINRDKQDIHQALIDRDEARMLEIFRNPGSAGLFNGFEVFCPQIEAGMDWGAFHASLLTRLAEALGVCRLENPESYPAAGVPPFPSVDTTAAKIGAAVPFEFELPSPYPNMLGIQTPYGLGVRSYGIMV